MDKLTFVEPSLEHRDQAIEFALEFKNNASPIEGSSGLMRFLDNYESWLEKINSAVNIKQDNYNTPNKTFFLVRTSDQKIVGIANLRLKLNKKFLAFGGSLGGSIRPSERKKGYSSILIYLALMYFNSIHTGVIMMDCDKKNLASARSIVSLGGKLLKEVPIPSLECIKQDYFIDVEHSLDKYAETYLPYVDDSFLLNNSEVKQK